LEATNNHYQQTKLAGLDAGISSSKFVFAIVSLTAAKSSNI
jgi:hypothetical protein